MGKMVSFPLRESFLPDAYLAGGAYSSDETRQDHITN